MGLFLQIALFHPCLFACLFQRVLTESGLPPELGTHQGSVLQGMSPH